MFFYLKDIYLYSMKKKICYVKILSFKENTFIFNQNIFVFKKFYFHPGFLFSIRDIKNICLFNQKLMRSMKFFYSMIFGSQIWSSIWKWNGVKFLHGLYSDFDAYVSHENELHLPVSVFRFDFWLRRVNFF